MDCIEETSPELDFHCLHYNLKTFILHYNLKHIFYLLMLMSLIIKSSFSELNYSYVGCIPVSQEPIFQVQTCSKAPIGKFL